MAGVSTVEQLISGDGKLQCTVTKQRKSENVNRGLDHENIILDNLCGEFKETFDVGFENLSYIINEGFFSREGRILLNKVNGQFRAGHLTAIMGPSGSGKSTLMNILAGYTKEYSGNLLINGETRDEQIFRRQSCYIMQNDQLQPLLTVSEAMNVAVNLNMSTETSHKKKQIKVKETLMSMGLWKHRKVRTHLLSGGQRKRLSIALELLKNPQIMFFDEPTSGLDSVTSKQCIMLLKELALTGRTIICSIHQPSAILFEMFDHLYVVAKGHCVYQGEVRELLPYLQEMNLICPTYHNPADFLLEVAAGDLGDHFDKLLQKSENGINSHCMQRKRESVYQCLEHLSKIEDCVGEIPPGNASIAYSNWRKSDRRMTFEPTTLCCQRDYSTSSFNQLLVLLKRNYIILSRDKTLTYSRILTHLSIALFIGFLYYGIGTQAQNMLNNFNYLFFSVMFLMMTAFNCVSTTFPSELPIVTREHFNKWYSLKSYYLAITLADIPIQIFATLLYGTITYFLTQQPTHEPYRIGFFMLMCVLISLVAQSFGLLIGASMDVKNGVIFGPFCFLPFTIFSGFFVQFSAAHPYFRWVFHISFLKYGLEGLVLSVLGYRRGKLPCKADYCHYVYPRHFLRNMDMEHADYWLAVSFMVGLILLIRVAAYFALSIQIERRRT